MQTTSSILMVRPSTFGFNPQTAASNAFQQELAAATPEEIKQKAIAEFDNFVKLLQTKGIEVVVIDDTTSPGKPDAIFPNNWISLHQDGRVALYPMQAPNRRLERRLDIIEKLKLGYQVKELVDFTNHEENQKYLEGTGSMILDHENRLVYACLSPRTNINLLEEFCFKFDYRPITFQAYDHRGGLVYHTNVILCIGQKFAVLCTETIRDVMERRQVLDALSETGHEIIAISQDQLRQYAGNMLEVQNQEGQPFLVLSEQAYKSLLPEQIATIEKYAEIIAPPIYTIEHIGGGSARCMMAEIFLPRKK